MSTPSLPSKQGFPTKVANDFDGTFETIYGERYVNWHLHIKQALYCLYVRRQIGFVDGIGLIDNGELQRYEYIFRQILINNNSSPINGATLRAEVKENPTKTLMSNFGDWCCHVKKALESLVEQKKKELITNEEYDRYAWLFRSILEAHGVDPL